MLQCPWCGAFYDDSELSELDHAKDGSGVWCDCCDSFCFFEKSKAARHRMSLLLERGGASAEMRVPATPSYRLRKHLSPLRYPGGKSRVIDSIFVRLQRDKMDCFVEVFAGGASLGLSLLDSGCIGKLVLNDVDRQVYLFWRSVLESPGYLLSRLERAALPTHKDFWEAKEAIAAFQQGDAVPEDWVAWSFFLLNRLTYSGIQMAHPMGGKHGSQQQLLSRWNPKELQSRILHIHQMADKIELHNLDCCAFLEQLAAWYPRCTLFCDPPYYVKGPLLYPTAFSAVDHERLAYLLNDLYRGFDGPDIILTYDDAPEVRELYPYATIEHLNRAYSIAN